MHTYIYVQKILLATKAIEAIEKKRARKRIRKKQVTTRRNTRFELEPSLPWFVRYLVRTRTRAFVALVCSLLGSFATWFEFVTQFSYSRIEPLLCYTLTVSCSSSSSYSSFISYRSNWFVPFRWQNCIFFFIRRSTSLSSKRENISPSVSVSLYPSIKQSGNKIVGYARKCGRIIDRQYIYIEATK